MDPGTRFSYLEFAPGGDLLFAGTSWEELLILDASTLEVVGREPFGIPFSWSPDGTRLLLRDSDTSLIVRQGRNGPTVARLEPVDDDTNAAGWSPDGKQVVTASSSGRRASCGMQVPASCSVPSTPTPVRSTRPGFILTGRGSRSPVPTA